MIESVSPAAPWLVDWLYGDALMAVQSFLVVGGFLSARSLAPRLHELSSRSFRGWTPARLAWRRYVRLARPYVPALLLAILFAAAARALMADPDTPAAPSLRQVFYHLLLLHDIVDVDALSTGVWYVAIDFQLFCVLLALLWAAPRLAAALRVRTQTAALFLSIGLAAASVLWLNRDASLDVWAVYFFGAYGLGALAHWCAADGPPKRWHLVALLAIYALALALEWRTRLVVSLATAALLVVGLNSGYRPRDAVTKVFGWFSRISYAAFLVHYPVVLLVGAACARIWPNSAPMAAAGFAVAWLATLFLANALYRVAEAPRPQAAGLPGIAFLRRRFAQS